MRIILFMAAAAGAAAMAGPLLAQTSSMIPQRGHPHASAANASAGWILRSHRDFRRGTAKRPGRGHRGDRGRHRGRFGPDDGFFYSYGFAGAFDMVEPHGNGFFAAGGGDVVMRGGRPHYDYDRSYPYEWASADGSRFWMATEADRQSETSCSLERGVRVCRGAR